MPGPAPIVSAIRRAAVESCFLWLQIRRHKQDGFNAVLPGRGGKRDADGTLAYIESLAFSPDSMSPTHLSILGYYNGSLHDHFYTQYGTTASGYGLQGVAWHAEP